MRTRRTLQATVTALALAALTACGQSEPVAHVSEWSAFDVPRYGLSGALPSGWRLAPRTQTPRLDDPREIVTAATFAPGPALERCNHRPVAAIAAMGRTDALVTVQERGAAAPVADFPARPAHFAAAESPGIARTVQECLGGPLPARVSRQEFRDGTRAFHVLVALGPDASPATEAEALGVLDRLRFDQRFEPDWAFAG
jgi:hypothetical protein